jgi:hypothetical protein
LAHFRHFRHFSSPWPRPGLQECIFGDCFSEPLLQQQGIPIISRQGRL